MRNKFVSRLLKQHLIMVKNAMYYVLSDTQRKEMSKKLKTMSMNQLLGTLPLPTIKRICAQINFYSDTRGRSR